MGVVVSSFDPLDRFRLDGRVAIVTGASSGLGARFARVLDAAGARVALVARRRGRREEVAADLLNEPLVIEADVTADGAPTHIVDATLAAYGRVDVLVNN